VELFAAADRLTVSMANMYRRDSTGKIVQFWGEQDVYGLLCGLEMVTPRAVEL
jgi:hypothetical protein